MKKIAVIFFNLGLGGVQHKIVDLVNFAYVNTRTKQWHFDIILGAPTSPSSEGDIQNPFCRIFSNTARPRHILRRLIPRADVYMFLFLHFLTHDYSTVLVFLTPLSVALIRIKRVLFWKRFKVVIVEDVDPVQAFLRGEMYREEYDRLSFTYNRAEHVIVPSEHVRKLLKVDFGVTPNKISKILHWSTRVSTHVYEKTIDILYVGRVDAGKNVIEIIHLLKHLPRKNIRCVIVGDGDQKKHIQKIARKEKVDISFIRTEQVTDYYKKAKILVSFSPSEGLPFVFVEAMENEAVIVARRFPGIEEILVHRKTGYICDTTCEMATYINLMLGDSFRQKAVSRNAKRVSGLRYSISNMKKYFNFL